MAQIGARVVAVAKDVDGQLVGVPVSVGALAESQADVLPGFGILPGAEDRDAAVVERLVYVSYRATSNAYKNSSWRT